MNVAQTIASGIEKVGNKTVYGLVGVSILDFLDAVRDTSLRYISTRHEQTAVSMADAEGRLTKRPGVAVVHAGPGFLNSVTGIAIAYKDSSPLLVISGSVKRRMKGLDSWLEVDQSSIARPITKAVITLDKPVNTASAFSQAYSIASSPPFGPVLLEVPEDIWYSEADGKEISVDIKQVPMAESEMIAKVLKLIEESERPMIIAGGGINSEEGSKYLLEISERYSIPVAITGNARGVFPEDHTLYLGRAGFGGGSIVADFALESADLILAIGGGISDVTTYGYLSSIRGKKVVVDLDPIAEKKPIFLNLHYYCDGLSFLKSLLQDTSSTKHSRDWLNTLKQKMLQWKRMLDLSASRTEEGYVNPSKFFALLNQAIPKDVILTAGQGVHILYVYDYIQLHRPNSFLAATNLGAMGFALPAALGAKVMHPEREVISILGDGEFLMTFHDLETVAREKIAAKFIIVNDNSYRVLYMRQKLQKMGRIIGTTHGNPDITKIGEAFGIPSLSINSDRDIDDAIDFLLGEQSQRILELKINPEEMPPLNLDLSSRF
ncbi:MAG: thiamine pyrophosphate-binding protein [Conexivisphaerales archaeon]